MQNLAEVDRSAVRERNMLMVNVESNKNIHRDMNRYNVPATGEIAMIFSETQLPFILKRRQFLALLSFAMTIHKSQGQSFDKVSVYLHSSVFVRGQLYVALSRVRYANGLRVYVADNGDQEKHENGKVYTRNVVHTKPL